jgi:hypothetical protein
MNIDDKFSRAVDMAELDLRYDALQEKLNEAIEYINKQQKAIDLLAEMAELVPQLIKDAHVTPTD